MNLATSINSIRKKLTSATADITNEIAQLRKQIAEKRKEIAHVEGAPLSIAEIEIRAQEIVKKAGEWWTGEYGSGIIFGEDVLGAPNPSRDIRLPWWSHGGPSWEAQCAGEPERCVLFLVSLARQIEFEPGPPLEERPHILEALEAELSKIEAGEERIIDEANSAGVTIAHRSEVVQRRDQEARGRQLEEEKLAARKARQDALDRSYVQSRSVRSRYIESGKRKV